MTALILLMLAGVAMLVRCLAVEWRPLGSELEAALEEEAEPVISAIRRLGELAERVKTNHLKLVDVREPHEYQISRIPGAELIPLGELAHHLARALVFADHLGADGHQAVSSFLVDRSGSKPSGRPASGVKP